MHESFESPGAFENWLKDNNSEITYTRVYDKEDFPENISFDFLLIMGGPQSPATTTEECSYFNYMNEVSFIKKTIDADKYVLGVCLGAQMIGEALGAKFEHSPNKEIGVFELSLNDEGKRDVIFSKFPEKFMVGHWHGDMPGLTEKSEILATSEGCPRQIVRYTPKIYGFQCHFEFTSQTIDGMIENNSHELDDTKRYIENAKELKSHDYQPINQLLFQFLDKFVGKV